jgi:A/G-specific adenine glycosylase
VIPYFERFLKAFPTVVDLAAADEQDVLRLWEGLGYYRRARDLHRAAQEVVHQYGGKIPEDPMQLQALPGIGRYTTGAILSQAFDQRQPILEANSQRVLCRLFARAGDLKRNRARHWLWQAAEALLPAAGAGEFNQALMELGALVCTPTAPKCLECPLAKPCLARRRGIQEKIPSFVPAPETIFVNEAAVVIRRGRSVCLAQRPQRGRWAGLWEFPHAPLEKQETYEQAVARFLPGLTGIEVELGSELAALRHSVTRHRITLVCFEARHLSGKFRSNFYQQGKWVKAVDLQGFPVSAPQRRLAQVLINPDRQRHFLE